jgi:hypothetical protein
VADGPVINRLEVGSGPNSSRTRAAPLPLTHISTESGPASKAAARKAKFDDMGLLVTDAHPVNVAAELSAVQRRKSRRVILSALSFALLLNR